MHRPSFPRVGPGELGRAVQVVAILLGCLLVAASRQVRCLVTGSPPRWDAALADGAVTAFARLGPTFVKLGQLIASSPGMFPDVLSTAALRCLDDMPPFPAAIVRRRVAEDLGAPIDRLFASFDDLPLAAASIAQVHACVLPDGREAVVKVRRPAIRRRMARDLRIMYLLASVLDRYVELARTTSMVAIVGQLYETTCKELNFALEAHNQSRFAASIDAFGDNPDVTAPSVYWSHCGPRTICMQRLHGTPLNALDGGNHSDGGVDRRDDTELVVRRGVKVWLEAAILHGPFHGDVHAGNLWLLDDGRLAYLDFGIMGQLGEQWRELLKDMLYTAMFDRDFARIARGLRRCGVLDPAVGTDTELGWALGAMFNPVLDAPVARLRSRSIADMLLGIARQYAGTAPPEMALLTKQLLYFERYSAELAPNWVLAKDPYLLRNVFPTETAALGVPMQD